MQLTILGAIRALLPFGNGASHAKAVEEELAKIQNEDHTYIKGNDADRGPCPGLNSLANQGYIPRTGRQIPLPQIEAALQTALHHSPHLSQTLAAQLKPLCRPSSSPDGTLKFDLADMRRHNVIERDLSFTRLGFRQGDNHTFQPGMFHAMLADAADTEEEEGEGATTTVKSLARTYKRRQREEKESGAPGLGVRLYFISLVQTVSFLHSADVGGGMSREDMTEFFAMEKFPDSVTGNGNTRRLSGLVGMTLELAWYLWFGKAE